MSLAGLMNFLAFTVPYEPTIEQVAVVFMPISIAQT
jgi:hypothetical protein